MTGSPANLGLADFPTDRRWRFRCTELKRIHTKLEEFLSPQDARDTTRAIYDLVLEVDQELNRILRDPLLRELYEYDGRFFTPKSQRGFHRAFDGVHILRWLSGAMLETFYSTGNPRFATRWLMEELGKHVWEAKLRRKNWEESCYLGLLSREVVADIVRDFRGREARLEQREREAHSKDDPPPLSPQEKGFFQYFEDQMKIDETSAC